MKPQQLGYLAALLLLSSQASASTCLDLKVSPSVGLMRSQWNEYSSTGSHLVKESGTLQVRKISAELDCSAYELGLTFSQADGRRTYSGLTQREVRAITASEIKDQSIQLMGFIPFNSRWSGGIGIDSLVADRIIRSTEQALGYPERFKQWGVHAGARYELPMQEKTLLTFSFWGGKILRGNMWLDLPNADPVQLSLGSGYTAQARLNLESQLISLPGWSLSTSVHWRHKSTAEGQAAPLLRNNRMVGTARQPKTTVQSLELSGSLNYAF